MVICGCVYGYIQWYLRNAVEDGRVIITPVEDTSLTLEQRLALFDPVRHGGETMVTEPLGG